MRSIEKTGKKPEDAINAGLKELGCDLSDVTIDILDAGSPGLFGMFGRLAKVRLTVKEEEELNFDFDFTDVREEIKSKPAANARRSEKAPKPAPAKQPKADKPRAEKPEKPVKPEPQPEPEEQPEPQAETVGEPRMEAETEPAQ